MKDEAREDFERRLLALVRDFMNNEPDEREIGEFAVIYEILFVDEDGPLDAWGRGASNDSAVGASFSTRSEWIQEALAREALERVEQRRSYDDHDADDEDEDEDDEDVDEPD